MVLSVCMWIELLFISAGKAIKFGVEAKSWPRGLHHWENERKKMQKE